MLANMNPCIGMVHNVNILEWTTEILLFPEMYMLTVYITPKNRHFIYFLTKVTHPQVSYSYHPSQH